MSESPRAMYNYNGCGYWYLPFIVVVVDATMAVAILEVELIIPYPIVTVVWKRKHNVDKDISWKISV